MQTVGATNVMFGTDHPFDVADPEKSLSVVEAALTERERIGVLSAAAERWFGLPTAA